MPRSSSPSFVCEFEVQATSRDRRVLRVRREAARQLYNAVLGEALRRLARMRKDPGFALAKAMPRGKSYKDALGKARSEAFQVLRKRHGFLEFDLHAHPSLAKDCWLRGHLDVHASQKIASRAFKAVERYSFGQSGRPRFKLYGELESVEGKSNAAGIRYRMGHILWNGWFANLDLPLIVKTGDQVQVHGLKVAEEGKVKYCRLLSRTIRGQERAFAQFVLEGAPWTKLNAEGKPMHPVAAGKSGGMDLGPWKVAVVTEGKVKSFPFCGELDRKEKARRRYQRQIDRQRRAKNPSNYLPDGQIKKGPKHWEKSKRQKRAEARLTEIFRVQTAHRKSLQGALAHGVLSMANVLTTEKVNKRSWMALWGRSVGHKSPGMFQTRVGMLAKASGGGLEEISTYKTFLSSRCLCGLRKKKALKERKHLCGCDYIPDGMFVDRDEFSAYLAMFSQGSTLDEKGAREAWSWGADCLLLSLSSSTSSEQTANEEAKPRNRRRELRQSGSTDKQLPGQRREGTLNQDPSAQSVGGIYPSKGTPDVEGGLHVA